MRYLVFKTTNLKTNEETLYLYNAAPTTEREVKAWKNYAYGVIKREIELNKEYIDDYRITVTLEPYREFGTHLKDYKFIEPPKDVESDVFVYSSPKYPVLNKVGYQAQGSKWVLSGLSRGDYNKT